MKKMFKKALCICTLLCMGASSTVMPVTAVAEVTKDYGLLEDVSEGQILQIWNWSFEETTKNMELIAKQGFSAIQTSPIQQAKERTTSRAMESNWWVFYQPAYFQIDNSGQSGLGDKAEFEAMCAEAEKYGISVIVDAVLNHTGDNGGNNISPAVDPELQENPDAWHDISKSTSNWNSRHDITQYNMGGLPDLNTNNDMVQQKAIDFLIECIDAGADGFRYDGAKHIEVPGDTAYNVPAPADFWPNVTGAINDYASEQGVELFHYGEILDKTAGGQTIIDEYQKYMSVTVNTTSNGIRNAVRAGNATSASNSLFSFSTSEKVSNDKAVLWNESHDTYADGSTIGLSDTTLNKTWAIVGARSGATGMYFARPENFNDEIGTAGLTGWTAPEVKAVNDFNNEMQTKYPTAHDYLSSSGKLVMNEYGQNGAIIVNLDTANSGSVNMTVNQMVDGTYIDTITNNTFTVANGKITGEIGETGIAVVYNPEMEEAQAYITPGTSVYTEDTITLTLSAKDATSAQYTIDGGEPVSYTDGQTLVIGDGVANGATTTVTVEAFGEVGNSGVQTYEYTKQVVENAVTLYFDNSTYKWKSVYAYVYTGDGETAVAMKAWPGTELTLDDATGYYTLGIPKEFKDGAVIFTESSAAPASKRHPDDGDPGMPIEGKNKLFVAGNEFIDYITEDAYKAGDVDGNGMVNTIDILTLQRYIADIISLSDEAMSAADMTGDGIVNTIDSLTIQKKIAEIL